MAARIGVSYHTACSRSPTGREASRLTTTPTSDESNAAATGGVLDRFDATLRIARPGWIVLFAILLAVYGWRAATHPGEGDTRFYSIGAERFFAGQNLYFDLPYEGHDRNNTSYTYPPPFAVVSAWMLVVPYPAARVLWLFAMATCLVGSLILTWQLISLNGRPKRPDLTMAVACLVIARFAVNDLAHGQVNWLIAFLLLLGLLRAEEQRPWSAGLFLGLALVIKPTAWLLVPFYALARRDTKLIFACALTGGVLLLLPGVRYGPAAYADVCADWLRLMESFTRHSAGSPDNASLVGTLTRYGAGAVRKGQWEKLLFAMPPAQALLWARGATLVLIGGLFALLCWRRGRSTRAPALVLVLGALLSPITWKAHLVLLLLPAAWVCKRIIDRPTRGGWIGLGALLALLLLPSRGLLDLGTLEAYGGLTAGIALLGLLAAGGGVPNDVGTASRL